MQSRLSARWLGVKTGFRQRNAKERAEREKKKKLLQMKREMYKTPDVNEAAYLSAVSVMCKQRPFRAARHTIALFVMQ